ncbi:DUF4270 domain-containing protein [Dysgonomonas sp. 511]|uniref:DUF4270 domain-containing protein n=1 Tax=Dysgonomonas sp. 511 TaxID=2302930 RepID=UPI0013D84005|nr:DUF4270 domain-containing protein [Dysgonomonas sp. 511]NDV78169.1 DUF4270 domain-containing protein [Dysgonomonas sp. 511]
MKIKTLLFNLAILLSSATFIACDDDLSTIGSNIQPEDDGITLGTDTIVITAETVSFKDSIYARSLSGLLGEYSDPIFGKVKSDYLCEFFTSSKIIFEENTSKGDYPLVVDSVFLDTQFASLYGDTISPMGIGVYEVTKDLAPYFFTSIDPLKYCDMTKLLGQSIFTIKDVPFVSYSSYTAKKLSTRLDIELGERFLNAWNADKTIFENPENLRSIFKGVYVTSTFGNSSLVSTFATDINVYYTYHVRNAADTGDSTAVGIFTLPVSTDVIQMNRVKNEMTPEQENDIFGNPTKSYMKTPAGLYTQLTIPLQKIKEMGLKEMNNKSHIINSAALKIYGNTEEEESSGFSRPTNLLLINKDSLPNFFYNRKKFDNETSFQITRSSNNSYDLGNIATIVNYYTKKYKDMDQLPDLHYLLIPVNVTYVSSASSAIVEDVYNMMSPTSAILRTGEENMKMSLIFSRYNSWK